MDKYFHFFRYSPTNVVTVVPPSSAVKLSPMTDTALFSPQFSLEDVTYGVIEDCCRPSCAAANWVQEKGLPVDPDYNVFYSCNRAGVPFTEPEK